MARTILKKVWVARDIDGDLFAYEHRPFYVESWGGMWMAPKGAVYKVKNLLFDNLKNGEGPIEAKIFSSNLERLKY